MPRKPFSAPFERVFDPDKKDPLKGLKDGIKAAFKWSRSSKAGESREDGKQSS